MILIFSYSGDFSTDRVIDWLNYYKYPFLRFNSSAIFNESLRVDLLERNIYVDGILLPIDKINAIWYRKFGLIRDFDFFNNPEIEFKTLLHLHHEHVSLWRSICYILKNKKWLTDPNKSNLNKCAILLEASEFGLKIPATYIVNNKKELLNILDDGNYIIKSIYDSFFVRKEYGVFSMYTKELTKELFNENDLPDFFSASLMQEKIDKLFEIRVFYINSEMFAMAIFSQTSSQTQDDFRDYVWSKPNRNVPYKLPSLIKQKIHKLMKKVGLNCGSLDLIKGIDGNYYFLEINPVGQFGMIEIPCNMSLHQKVALELIKMDK